jgi:hypothetical protein
MIHKVKCRESLLLIWWSRNASLGKRPEGSEGESHGVVGEGRTANAKALWQDLPGI